MQNPIASLFHCIASAPAINYDMFGKILRLVLLVRFEGCTQIYFTKERLFSLMYICTQVKLNKILISKSTTARSHDNYTIALIDLKRTFTSDRNFLVCIGCG